MIYFKLIPGWVAQHYDSDTGDCVQQEFVVDQAAPIRRENAEEQEIPESEAAELASLEKECAPDMVQP